MCTGNANREKSAGVWLKKKTRKKKRHIQETPSSTPSPRLNDTPKFCIVFYNPNLRNVFLSKI